MNEAAPHLTDAAEQPLADVLRALADPVRLRIVAMVAEAGELTCGPLAEALQLPQSTLSRHLRLLREAGVTYSRPDGPLRWVGLRAAEFAVRYPGLLPAVTASIGASGEA